MLETIIEKTPISRLQMLQEWEYLLFMHWPVSPITMKAHLPSELEMDLYNGQAWISIVSFKVSKIRVNHLPRIPYVRPMLQVNVRTYVKRNNERGVYFFSIDANKLTAVLGARMVTLPFFHADMVMKRNGNRYDMYSSRKGKDQGKLQVSYQPFGEVFSPKEPSLDHWLLERYILWTSKFGSLYRGDIQHKRWTVQHAEVKIDKQTLFSFLPEDATGENLLVHYAKSKAALNWMLEKAE